MANLIKRLFPALLTGAAIVAGEVIFKHVFQNLDANIVRFIAAMVVIFLLLMIYLMQEKGIFSKFRDRIVRFIPPLGVLVFVTIITGTAIFIIPIDGECIGRSPGSSESFIVYPDYDPSGYMGDTGDLVSVNKKSLESVRFTYEVEGRGPHEWEFKYTNNKPAKFAGIMYLSPPNNWGQQPAFDLRTFSRAISWEARSYSGEVNVEFLIGGVHWVWDDTNRVKIKPPCPDSLRRKPLGIYTLTEEWQSFEVDLSDIPKDEFINVIGGFAWVITWGSNEILANETGTGPNQTRTFEFEIRNIRYQKMDGN